MNTNEIFQLGCQKIYEQLADYGFNSTKKGQLLKKSSKDKKLTFEIYFQSSMKNWSGSVAIYPYISISSVQLKKWQSEKYNSEHENGIVISTRMEELTPLKNKNHDWNIALNNQENIIPKLCETIKLYILPVFDKFEDCDQIINEIAENGMKLNEHFETKHINLPIDFLYFFGSHETAQKAFDNYLIEQKLTGNAKRVFEQLKTTGQSSNKFITDLTMKKAYLNQLIIK